ncbi:MAG TPA: hypothetical protein VIT85_04245 [Solirubrobacterales bacterium]
MGILDEAIREHLELKRQHGADDGELKQLEDDAFGPPGRPGDEQPDPVAEAATEFMAQPDLGDGDEEPVAEAPARRRPTAGLVDLQEAPETAKDEPEPEPEPEGDDETAAKEDEPEPAAEEDHPAGEHEAVPEPVQSGPNTEERHAIADQPTEMYDVEEAFGDAEAAVPTEEPAPADEDLVAEEISEPRLVPSEPIHDLEPAAEAEQEDSEEDDAFWNEQRLSDELDQALEAPVTEPESDEHVVVEDEPVEPEPASDHTQVYETVPEHEQTDEHEAVSDRTDEHEPETPKGDTDHDALEETPDFLEEAPEDDRLWFEQKPPKDFDFDD